MIDTTPISATDMPPGDYAIVEALGHRTLIGRVCEIERFGTKMPAEVARAAKVVKDMLRRGFALLVEVGHDDKGPLYRRVHDFDEATTEYNTAATPRR